MDEPAYEPAPKERIRLLLVDELGLFRASLARFLASEPGLEVAGQCGTSAEALELLKLSAPDVLLLGSEVGNHNSVDFVSSARAAEYQGHFCTLRTPGSRPWL